MTDPKKTSVELVDWKDVVERSGWALTITLDGKTLTFATEAYAAMHGYAVDEIRGLRLDDVNVEDEGGVPLAERLRTLQREGWLRFEGWRRRKDGSVFRGLVELTRIARGDGLPPYMLGMVRDISEDFARRTELARYQEFFQHVATPMVLFDLEDRVLDVSDPALELSGMRREDVLGKPMRAFVPGPLAVRFAERHRAVIATGAAATFEDELPLPSGLLRILTMVSPVRDAKGALVAIQHIAQDVTARRRAEEVESTLGRLLESSNNEVYVVDPETLRFHMVNRAALEHMGYTGEEFAALQIPDVAPDFTPDRLAGMMAAISDGKSKVSVRGEHQRKDGTRYPVRINAELTHFQGKPMALGIIFDETEIDRAQRAVAESEERYRRLAENSQDVIFRLESGPRFTYLSPSCDGMLGVALKVAEANASALLERFAEKGRAGFEAALIQASSGRTPVSVETPYERPDGQRLWLHVRFASVKTESLSTTELPAVEGSMTDITARKHAEEQVREMNALLEARVVERTRELVSANQELETFSYSVSHDLRAPLRAIDGFTSVLLEESPNLNAAAKDAGGRVLAAVGRMSKLVDDLLRLSRLGRLPLRRSAYDVGASARRIAEALPRDQRAIELVGRETAKCQADPALLDVVLQNLLENAWKFTRGVAAPRVEVGSVAGAAEPIFFVKDNGVGFDVRYERKVFEAFERLHGDMYEGTGIGLAIVARIVSRHGGRVWAESQPGKGTTFFFSVPNAGADP